MSGASSPTLALFDLDHTLIPFDSGMAWTRFLVARGVLTAEAQSTYLSYCQQYLAGTLDIHAMHRASLQPLLRYAPSVLAQWRSEFEHAMRPRIPASTRALVARHREAGDLCAVVTATTAFIAEPFARLFGIDHVVATRAATVDGSPGSAFTGEIDGDPCYRGHKITRVRQWLALRPAGSPSTLAQFARSWFYSDSISDLPLLGVVSNPVVVRPDGRLRAHAQAHGWPVIDPD